MLIEVDLDENDGLLNWKSAVQKKEEQEQATNPPASDNNPAVLYSNCEADQGKWSVQAAATRPAAAAFADVATKKDKRSDNSSGEEDEEYSKRKLEKRGIFDQIIAKWSNVDKVSL